MKNSFVVKYAVHRWLLAMSVSGPFGALITFIATRFLGDLLDRGLIKVDIGIDQLKQAFQEKQWRKDALEYYQKAGARLYTEEEKDAIRKEYMDALSSYATYGNGMPKR